MDIVHQNPFLHFLVNIVREQLAEFRARHGEMHGTVDNAYGTHFYSKRRNHEILHDIYAEISYEHPKISRAIAAGHYRLRTIQYSTVQYRYRL